MSFFDFFIMDYFGDSKHLVLLIEKFSRFFLMINNMLKSSSVFFAIPPNNLLSTNKKMNFISTENNNHWTILSLRGKTHDFSTVVAASKNRGSSSRLTGLLGVLLFQKKGGAKLVRLISSAGTGFFSVTNKPKPKSKSIPKESLSKKKENENFEFRKYDPRVNRHVLFTEAKMK